ncbi:DUF4192 domain-containing protein [Nocardiopsis algeriensis]|uniref:DUF4192 domain-containing protein n=1 Tax=Nocardiopsis algeriensis TaxID=1478215 RepID=A0A841ILX0_9ACTN|nr:DUF4192 domain-containing protein [Nocardiopsis algeriensis]MBB6119024.1 hypothetical protein [Nocardiopsis algeriensis]
MHFDQERSPGPSDPDPSPRASEALPELPRGCPRPADGASADRPPSGGAPSRVPPPRRSAAPPARLKLRNPTDIIATMPYLVGEPPDPGIVVLAIRGEGIHTAYCGALDSRYRDVDPVRRARPLLQQVVADGCAGVLVVAYGPALQVTPYVDAVRTAALECGVTVVDALRVTEGRYWSYTCPIPSCCPAEGTVVNVDSSPVPADAVLSGIAPVPSFKDTVADLERVRGILEPLRGPARAEQDAASEEAVSLAGRMLAEGREQVLIRRGLAAVRRAVEEEGRGRGLTGPEELAWLGVHLTRIRVRDAAWADITEHSASVHQELWARLTRHLPEHQRAAPASLLAVAAWQQHDNTLAAAAVGVALAADPEYSMARLMGRALAWGLPVERWREFAPQRPGEHGGDPQE